MSKPFEFKVDEDAKPLTKKEAMEAERAMILWAFDEFIRERNEALLSLDREKIERYAEKYGVTMPDDEETFWRGVHKAICHITDIPFEVRQKSADWLFDHGSTLEIGEEADG